jgi:hypothetical protein
MEVIKGNFISPTEKAGDLAERIIDLVYEYRGILGVATVIGVLNIASLQIIKDAEKEV